MIREMNEETKKFHLGTKVNQGCGQINRNTLRHRGTHEVLLRPLHLLANAGFGVQFVFMISDTCHVTSFCSVCD